MTVLKNFKSEASTSQSYFNPRSQEIMDYIAFDQY